MSQFLPEVYQGKGATQDTPGQASTGSDSLLSALIGDDQRFDALIKAMFNDPNRLFRVAPNFFSYLVSWVEQSGLQIPISQVPGFNKSDALRGRISAAGGTTDGVGFTSSSSATGQYRILYNTPFAKPPSVVAGFDFQAGNPYGFIQFLVSDENEFDIKILDAASSPQSVNWQFVVTPILD